MGTLLRRALVGISLAAGSISAGGGLCEPAWAQSPADEANAPVRCLPVESPIRVDGRLDEWAGSPTLRIGEEQLVVRDPQYFGPGDLSGEVFVARDAGTLYVAGRVRDDTLFWNARRSYRGDGVEVFLDLSPNVADRTADEGYDSFAHQLLLHPLAPDVPWNFASLRGRPGRPDDPIDGLELAGLPLRDEKDATVGYTFELAIPLHNLSSEPLEEGREIGFDVALSDSDGLPHQKNYATWSGSSRLSEFPGRFGRLLVSGEAQAPEPAGGPGVSPTAPLAVLLAVLAALLFAWLARLGTAGGRRLAALLDLIRRIPLKLVATLALLALGLLVAVQLAEPSVARRFNDREVESRRRIASRVREIAAEAERVRLLERRGDDDDAPLVTLLSGGELPPPVDHDFTPLSPVVEEPHRTHDGVPFLRRDIPLLADHTGRFTLHPAVRARRLTLVYSFRAGRPGERPERDSLLAEVRLARRDGSVPPPTLLRYGHEIDVDSDPVATDAGTARLAPAARLAALWQDDEGTGRHALALDIELPGDIDSPFTRLEVTPRNASGTVVLHGATLHVSGGAPQPLHLGRATRGGVPTVSGPFPAEPACLFVSADAPWHVLKDLDVRADALWLVVGLRKGFAAHRFRGRVALVDVVLDDGSVEGPFALENGISVESEAAPARQHGEGFRGEVAYEWGEPGAARRHLDVVALPFERSGRRIREIQIEFVGENEILRIAAITAGAVRTSEAEEEDGATQVLQRTDSGYRLAAQDAGDFAGNVFTLFRRGEAVATTLPGAPTDAALSRRLPAELAHQARASPDGALSSRVADGLHEHTLVVGVDESDPDELLEIAWQNKVGPRVGRTSEIVRAVLVFLLVPMLVLLVAHVLLRIPSLHVRLVLAVAAAAAVPVLLAAFAVPGFVGSKIEDAEQDAVLDKARVVRRRLADLRSFARAQAEAALGDEALAEALRRREDETFAAGVAAALRDIERSVSAAAGVDARVSLEVVTRGENEDEPVVFPEAARWTVFNSPVVNVTDRFAYRRGDLLASGVAKSLDSDGEGRTTLVVELPVDTAAIEEIARAAGGRTQVLLYTPSGYPLAGTLDTERERAPAEMARRRDVMMRVLAEQQPVVERAEVAGSVYTAAHDVLREGAEPVCSVVTALPRGRTDALLSRVENVSLFVFGAGLLLQFLLTGLVVGTTSGHFRRTLGRARRAAPETDAPPPDAGRGGAHQPDELDDLDGALRELRRDRDLYQREVQALRDVATALDAVRGPEEATERAVELVREALAPWGAVLVATDDAGALRVLGGFAGERTVPPCQVPTDVADLVAQCVASDDVATFEVAAKPADDDDAPPALLGGASGVTAYPLALDRPGALLLTTGPEGRGARRHHGDFAAAFARHVGHALRNARLVRMAVRDLETGAYVSGYFDRRLAEEADRAAAAKRPVGLVLVRAQDVGDPAGAGRRRQALVDVLRDRAPARAFVGVREDGALAVAVPDGDGESVAALARDLARTVAEQVSPGLRLTTGSASCPEDAGSAQFLMQEARRRLSREGDGGAAETSAESDARRRLREDALAAGVVFRSEKGLQLLETIERIAGSDLTLVIEGETGTGKEVVADLVHRKSARAGRPLVKVNCAALPQSLLESELFGYEPGAFTGATRRKPGRFELADGGTLFLDEIGEADPSVQAKLLRVLEDRLVEPLGSTRAVPVDVRIIVATNRDLRGEVAAGRFREDLFYRLNSVGVVVPPLRARRDDIPALADSFVRRAAESAGRKPPALAPDAMDLLFRHDWPGNVRELRNVVERAVVLAQGDVVYARDLRPGIEQAGAARPAAGSRAASSPGARPAVRQPSSAGARAPLSDRQRRLLAMLAERGVLTNSEYCASAGISTRTGLRDLKELLGRGLIVMEGKRRGARYRLA